MIEEFSQEADLHPEGSRARKLLYLHGCDTIWAINERG
jgi:hypothetical protein